MFMKLPALTLTCFGILQGTLAQQTTTLNIFPGDADAVDDLQGEVLGVGAKGTTYAISGVVSGIPATVTLVEGPTYLSEVFVMETLGGTARLEQACGLDENDSGLCTVVVSGGARGLATATTEVIPWTFTFAPVAIEVTGTPETGSSGDSSNAGSAIALPHFAALVAIAPIFGAIVTLW